MRARKENWLSQVVAAEKREMLPLNFMMTYRIAPLYVLISIMLITGFAILVSVDDTKYLETAMALMGALAVISIALLASLPFVRKKAIQAELAYYDFDHPDAAVALPLHMTADEHELYIDDAGIMIDGVQYRYDQLCCRIVTSNYCKRIRLMLWIGPSDEAEGVVLPFIPSTRAMLASLPLSLQNPEMLDYILRNREAAFRQIYDKGFIKIPE